MEILPVSELEYVKIRKLFVYNFYMVNFIKNIQIRLILWAWYVHIANDHCHTESDDKCTSFSCIMFIQ